MAVLRFLDGDTLALARNHDDPALVLHALRYLTPRRRIDVGLKAAAILAARLDLPPPEDLAVERVVSLAYAVNLATSTARAQVSAWTKLTREERRRLARTVDVLYTFTSSTEKLLALAAMRSVGDAATLTLLDRLPPPASERPLLLEIRAMTAARLSAAARKAKERRAFRAP